jgi:flap endonuclease-1
MGIHGLPRVIRNETGNSAIAEVDIKKLNNTSIAIDANLMLYQVVLAIRRTGKDMTNKNDQLTSHLHGFLYKILILLSYGITPIFVFDGKAPDIKKKTIESRIEKKKDAEKHAQKALDDDDQEEYQKNFQRTYHPKKEELDELKIMMDLMGIPYINAPGEAEAVCAWLSARYDNTGKRFVKGVCTDDSDVLPLGAAYMFKDMFTNISKNKPFTVISLNKTKKALGMTTNQFIDLCILLGCDYCDTLPGIGEQKSLKMIREHISLENVVKAYCELKKNAEVDLQCMIEARNYFRNALSELDEHPDFVLTNNNLKLRECQQDEFMDFMSNKHNFLHDKMKISLEKLLKYYKMIGVSTKNNKITHVILKEQRNIFVWDDGPSKDNEEETSGDEIRSVPLVKSNK